MRNIINDKWSKNERRRRLLYNGVSITIVILASIFWLKTPLYSILDYIRKPDYAVNTYTDEPLFVDLNTIDDLMVYMNSIGSPRVAISMPFNFGDDVIVMTTYNARQIDSHMTVSLRCKGPMNARNGLKYLISSCYYTDNVFNKDAYPMDYFTNDLYEAKTKMLNDLSSIDDLLIYIYKRIGISCNIILNEGVYTLELWHYDVDNISEDIYEEVKSDNINDLLVATKKNLEKYNTDIYPVYF